MHVEKDAAGSIFTTMDKWVEIITRVVMLQSFFFNRGDTTQHHGGLQSRELCQAPMLLVFLTHRQALSSHPRQCLCFTKASLFL